MNRKSIENIRIAIIAIRSQTLRSSLTALIIAIGITALVGILTSIDALKSSINDKFSSLGANSFSITNKSNQRKRVRGKQSAPSSNIDYAQAVAFRNKFDFPATVSVSCVTNSAALVKYENNESNPNISIVGIDISYLQLNGLDLKKGRNISINESNSGGQVVIIGSEIATEIFKHINPIDKFMLVGNIKFRVIGVLEEKG